MADLTRRAALGALAVGTVGTGGVACSRRSSEGQSGASRPAETTLQGPREGVVLSVFDLPRGAPWRTQDPFLFCVHHNDRYPRGNGSFGPSASLEGRDLGRDFSWKDDWNMYHGHSVPGFPAHPHRGFETVTVVRTGRLDHADSLGAAARYGDGDVQWLTAGAGIQHAEMFPLLSDSEENPLDLFQIWLNLPAKSKTVAPYFSMLWAEKIPTKTLEDSDGKKVVLTVRAGNVLGLAAPPPPPDSWAADRAHDVGIWTLAFEPGASIELPPALPGVARSLYVFHGEALQVGEREVRARQGAELRASVSTKIRNLGAAAEVLILQGKPIAEPIAQNGPFVMNTQAEIRKAYEDFRQTRFGGWPWPDSAPVHGSDRARFARQTNGKTEKPG